MIKLNGIYKHYKGNLYRVIGIGKHSENLEDMVIYQSIDNHAIWVRPLYMWEEEINSSGEKRFTLVEE